MGINLLIDDGILTTNPIKKWIKVEQPQPKKVILDSGYENGFQWSTIYNELADCVKPIAMVLYETGMRPVEVFHMRWHWLERLEEDFWVINVPSVDTVDGEIVFKEKTGKAHTVPVSPRLLRMFKLIGMQNTTDLIFPGPKNRGPRSDIESAFTNALKRSGLHGKGISPYCLRRTRATIWDRVDPVACMHALGHVSKEVHYRHYVEVPLDRLFTLVGLEYRHQGPLPGSGSLPEFCLTQQYKTA